MLEAFLVQVEAPRAQELSIDRFNIEKIADNLEPIKRHLDVGLVLVG